MGRIARKLEKHPRRARRSCVEIRETVKGSSSGTSRLNWASLRPKLAAASQRCSGGPASPTMSL